MRLKIKLDKSQNWLGKNGHWLTIYLFLAKAYNSSNHSLPTHNLPFSFFYSLIPSLFYSFFLSFFYSLFLPLTHLSLSCTCCHLTSTESANFFLYLVFIFFVTLLCSFFSRLFFVNSLFNLSISVYLKIILLFATLSVT